MCDSIYCAYILVILCIVLYMFFYEANKDDYYYSALRIAIFNYSGSESMGSRKIVCKLERRQA